MAFRQQSLQHVLANKASRASEENFHEDDSKCWSRVTRGTSGEEPLQHRGTVEAEDD
jgi:hypothetical protein